MVPFQTSDCTTDESGRHRHEVDTQAEPKPGRKGGFCRVQSPEGPFSRGLRPTADELDMRRLPIIVALSLLSSCAAPQYEAISPNTELRALTGNPTRSLLGSRVEPTVTQAEASAALPSRFSHLESGKITIAEDEYQSLVPLSTSLAALKPDQVMELVVDYGQTRDGLIRALKLIHLMQQSQRTAVIELLRPAELQTVAESPVVHMPGSNQSSTPTLDPANPGVVLGTMDVTPSARRYQIAGTGQTAWQTILDTATGVVYNYRNVDGRPQWVPITIPLPPGK